MWWLLCITAAYAAQIMTITSDGQTKVIKMENGTGGLMNLLDALPKTCHKGGKEYKEGESFDLGHLRYKCQQYGVYSIEGCQTEKKKALKLGESLVEGNLAHICDTRDGAVHYRQIVCGIMGQPSCDEAIAQSKKEEQSAKKSSASSSAAASPSSSSASSKSVKTSVPTMSNSGQIQLPPGWKIVSEGSQAIPGTQKVVKSQTMQFSAVPTKLSSENGFSKGVGRVLSVEELVSGKPVKIGTVDNAPSSSSESIRASGFKPGTVQGSMSSVSWNGKQILVDGKPINAGPGTFTFGTKKTSNK